MITHRHWLAANRDCVAVSALVAIALLTLESTGAVWLPLAVPFLLVLPGYVTATFAYARRDRERWTLTTVTKWLALALGGSMAVLPVLAILTYLSPLALTASGLSVIVSGYVFLGVVATAVRRPRSPEYADEDSTPATGGSGTLTTAVERFRHASLLQAILALSVVAAVATLGVAVAVPSDGSTRTDLHLLTEQDGRLVADEYPDSLTEGGSAPIIVGVTNDEQQPVEYTVVAELQRVADANRSTAVEERRALGRYTFELADGETWRQQLDIEGSLTGENLRFAVYLYRGEPPQAPTADSAYRNTYIWVDVQPADGA